MRRVESSDDTDQANSTPVLRKLRWNRAILRKPDLRKPKQIVKLRISVDALAWPASSIDSTLLISQFYLRNSQLFLNQNKQIQIKN